MAAALDDWEQCEAVSGQMTGLRSLKYQHTIKDDFGFNWSLYMFMAILEDTLGSTLGSPSLSLDQKYEPNAMPLNVFDMSGFQHLREL